MTKVIGISGGIGAGKSIVCKVLQKWGFCVFDCDREAKALMDDDDDIKEQICHNISTEAVCGNIIDRKRLAEIVFGDKEKLKILNNIVHSAVRQKFASWLEKHYSERIVFVESAILHSSGMNNDIDLEWRIIASDETRISRVKIRNGLNTDQIKARIKAQEVDKASRAHVYIENDGKKPLLPQLAKILHDTLN
ncbi:MAG: dephospho-CoA kinase [Lachnospiraceae bacterium]|nr:dephospho-CoA kinase [Lachnospiraceae bacterium]